MREFGPDGPLPRILGSAKNELVDAFYRITDRWYDTTRAAADGSRKAITAATHGDAQPERSIASIGPDTTPSRPGHDVAGRSAGALNDMVTVIYKRSAELGLHTPAQRALESSAFIDEPFLQMALVSRQKRPELLFGEREWAGYLDARAFARRHGDRDLSVPFMVELHQRLSRFTSPDRGGIFSHRRRSAPQPYPLTDKEIALVEANPYIEFRPPGTGGPFRHGAIEYRLSSPDEVEVELQSLVKWYNDARSQPGADSYLLATVLQRNFVSIHPWDYDYNGRSSRLLMNWSLERDGLPPSAVADFDKDLFTTIEEWTDTVRAGSDSFDERAVRLERLGDAADPIAVFGLERERERYLTLHGDDWVPLFEPGAPHDIRLNRALLERLRGNEAYDHAART